MYLVLLLQMGIQLEQVKVASQEDHCAERLHFLSTQIIIIRKSHFPLLSKWIWLVYKNRSLQVQLLANSVWLSLLKTLFVQ